MAWWFPINIHITNVQECIISICRICIECLTIPMNSFSRTINETDSSVVNIYRQFFDVEYHRLNTNYVYTKFHHRAIVFEKITYKHMHGTWIFISRLCVVPDCFCSACVRHSHIVLADKNNINNNNDNNNVIIMILWDSVVFNENIKHNTRLNK